MKDVESDIDQSLSECKEVKNQANFIKSVIIITVANWIVWFLKDKMVTEVNKKRDYIEDLRTAQDLNNCIKNYIKNKILELTGEMSAATKKTTFIENRPNEWFSSILK